jgi:hypothetical protein
MSRAGSAATAIALDLLGRVPGERIPTVAEYSKQLHVGIHTVQRALVVLERAGVELSPHGRNGTYLVSLERGMLWSIAMRHALVGYMPLPYSRRYEGLATGLRDALVSVGIPFNMAYMPGARVRLASLRAGSSFAVVSALACAEAARTGEQIDVVLDLQPGSFVASHGVIWRRGPRPARPRVGLDDNSFDQSLLSRAEFQGDAELVPAHYMQLVELVRRGALDAAVWALDAVLPDETIELESLTRPEAIALDRLATAATLVVAAGDGVVAQFLKDYVSPGQVLQVQAEVLTGSRIPVY